MAEEYLPATVGERVRDLRREKGLTQEELAGIIGISRSTVNRIESESKISADDALEIAKYFNVSVDFVLAKTDDPQVINYDLKVIGLSPEAAEKLYSNQVDSDVVNLLIENEKFGDFTKLVAFYLKGYGEEARRTANVLYSAVSSLLKKWGDNEDAMTVESMKEPVAGADLEKIKNCLFSILKDIKSSLDDNAAECRKDMKLMVSQLINKSMKTNAALRRINADEYAEFVVELIESRIPITDEMSDNLKEALVPIFKSDWRKKQK